VSVSQTAKSYYAPKQSHYAEFIMLKHIPPRPILGDPANSIGTCIGIDQIC